MPRVRSLTYRCNKCTREEVLTDSGDVRATDDLIRSWGWTVKQSGRNTLCPACSVQAASGR